MTIGLEAKDAGLGKGHRLVEERAVTKLQNEPTLNGISDGLLAELSEGDRRPSRRGQYEESAGGAFLEPHLDGLGDGRSESKNEQEHEGQRPYGQGATCSSPTHAADAPSTAAAQAA